jgi:hypothetical protein
VHRCQLGLAGDGQDRVVESSDRDLVRDLDVALAEGLDGPNGDEVIGARDDVREWPPLDDSRCRLVPPAEGEVADVDALVHPGVERPDPAQESIEPFLRRRDAGVRGDVGVAPAALSVQVIDELVNSSGVVDAHVRHVGDRAAVDLDQLIVAGREPYRLAARDPVADGDKQAVDLVVEKVPDQLSFDGDVVAGVTEQQAEPGIAQRRLYLLDQGREERVGDVGHDKADRLG